MRRCWIPILVVACAWSFGVRAQADIVERQLNASSGHDTRFGVYANVSADCTSGPLPAIKLVAAPAHGSVVVKRGTLKATNWRQCLATDVPVFVGFYRAAANFSGADEFEIEISYPGGRKQMERIRVNVADSEQHI